MYTSIVDLHPDDGAGGVGVVARRRALPLHRIRVHHLHAPGTVLDLRTINSQKCGAVPRMA